MRGRAWPPGPLTGARPKQTTVAPECMRPSQQMDNVSRPKTPTAAIYARHFLRATRPFPLRSRPATHDGPNATRFLRASISRTTASDSRRAGPEPAGLTRTDIRIHPRFRGQRIAVPGRSLPQHAPPNRPYFREPTADEGEKVRTVLISVMVFIVDAIGEQAGSSQKTTANRAAILEFQGVHGLIKWETISIRSGGNGLRPGVSDGAVVVLGAALVCHKHEERRPRRKALCRGGGLVRTISREGGGDVFARGRMAGLAPLWEAGVRRKGRKERVGVAASHE